MRQPLRSIYSLGVLDLRRMELEGIILDSFERFAEITGERLKFDGLGATLIFRGHRVILYRESAPGGLRRLNWTIAHEIGHALLCHVESTRLSEAEADVFAAELLMPEPAVRMLDELYGTPVAPELLTGWFNVSLSAAERRRAELDRRQYRQTVEGTLLKGMLFPTHVFSEAVREPMVL